MNITSPPKITKIYLVTNCYDDPNKVYIGKTISSRKKSHKKTFGNKIIYSYIDEINSVNRYEWIPLECFWIEYFRFLGFEIQNKNKGGSGVNFCTDEHKLKIGKSNQGKTKSETNKNIVSKKLSKSVLQYDLKNNFVKEYCSIKEAVQETKIWGVSSTLRGKQKTAGNFMWRYKEYPINTNFNISSHKGCIKIIQYDLNNNELGVWNSIKEASMELGIQETGISACCRGKKYTAGNFMWRYENDPINENYVFPSHRSNIKVIQMDMEKNFIKLWNSIKDAGNSLQIQKTAISQCCRGKYKTAGNFKWSYQD